VTPANTSRAGELDAAGGLQAGKSNERRVFVDGTAPIPRFPFPETKTRYADLLISDISLARGICAVEPFTGFVFPKFAGRRAAHKRQELKIAPQARADRR